MVLLTQGGGGVSTKKFLLGILTSQLNCRGLLGVSQLKRSTAFLAVESYLQRHRGEKECMVLPENKLTK